MAKKKVGPGRRTPRREPSETLPGFDDVMPVEESADDDELTADARAALRSKEPLDLLAMVSGLLAVLDPRTELSFDGGHRPRLTDLIDSLVAADGAEATAILTVMQALLPDDLTRLRIARGLAGRRHRLPRWLSRLGDARLEPDVWRLGHELRDSDAYLFGVTVPPGHALTAVVFVDHLRGTVVDDATAAPEPLSRMVGTMRFDLVEGQTLDRVDPADARAIMADAIDRSLRMSPQPETDSWPMSRPLVEWMLRMLPAGGSVPARVPWSSEQTARLTDEFFLSPFGAGLDDQDHRALLDNVVAFTREGTGDPSRWSDTAIRVLLLEWSPQQGTAGPDQLAKLPDLMRAFVPYAHDHGGIRHELTEETLAAVDELEPVFRQLIQAPGTTDPSALLAELLAAQGIGLSDALAQLDVGALADLELDLPELDEQLADEVGGPEQLEALSDDPLPDEAFGWDGIAEDVRPIVGQILDACDRCADELLDVEHRTAMRRFLAMAASADPAIFRRKASPSRTAAAIAWVICKGNGTAGGWDSPLTAREVTASFGVEGSVTQRAARMMRAAGMDPEQTYGGLVLGTPDLLVSARRSELIAERDGFVYDGGNPF